MCTCLPGIYLQHFSCLDSIRNPSPSSWVPSPAHHLPGHHPQPVSCLLRYVPSPLFWPLSPPSWVPAITCLAMHLPSTDPSTLGTSLPSHTCTCRSASLAAASSVLEQLSPLVRLWAGGGSAHVDGSRRQSTAGSTQCPTVSRAALLLMLCSAMPLPNETDVGSVAAAGAALLLCRWRSRSSPFSLYWCLGELRAGNPAGSWHRGSVGTGGGGAAIPSVLEGSLCQRLKGTYKKMGRDFLCCLVTMNGGWL